VASLPSDPAPARRPLLSVDDALARLVDAVEPIRDVEDVATIAARTRVLARPLTSPLDVPMADNSQMDGYALRAVDVAGARSSHPIRLPVAQRIPAGHVGDALAPGTVARIFTGALMPAGSDAVVMQEDVTVDGDHVAFARAVEAGAWIRRRGEDIRRDQVVLEAGTRLGPQHLGLAASIGLASLPVVRRPVVAMFSTGDELAMPGETKPEDLAPGALFNSNRFTMRALLEASGCDVVDLGIVPDTLAATREALVRAADGSDCILTSGGVSVGEEDHVRPAVAAEGTIDLWQIAIKPGKPFAYGRVRDAHFIGLPGNPVSGFVTFLVLVRPMLLKLGGAGPLAPVAYPLRADFDWPRPDQRREFLRARTNAAGGIDLHPKQGSAVMTSTVWADGLVDNPAGHAIARGDVVRFLPLASLLD
jgi:molybdopterin molybdotransferase